MLFPGGCVWSAASLRGAALSDGRADTDQVFTLLFFPHFVGALLLIVGKRKWKRLLPSRRHPGAHFLLHFRGAICADTFAVPGTSTIGYQAVDEEWGGEGG